MSMCTAEPRLMTSLKEWREKEWKEHVLSDAPDKVCGHLEPPKYVGNQSIQQSNNLSIN